MTAAEMSRPVLANRIGGGLAVGVAATAAECAAIAVRLKVPAVEAVACDWVLRAAPGDAFEAEGSLRARLRQVCVVSLEEFPVNLVEEFAVRFVPAGPALEGGDDPDEPDELPIEGGVLELGEATVEQLALALDPYPRKPQAALPRDAAASAANAFAALAKWRPPE